MADFINAGWLSNFNIVPTIPRIKNYCIAPLTA
jgi:hypothetical protein